jgi:hypothetical protein
MFEVNDLSGLITTLRKSFSLCARNWPDNLQTTTPFWPTRLHQRRTTSNRGTLPFKGDYATSVEERHPPLAWTLMYEGQFNPSMGENIAPLWKCMHSQHHDHQYDDHRRNGLIMWDARRIEGSPMEWYLSRFWKFYGRRHPKTIHRRKEKRWIEPHWPSRCKSSVNCKQCMAILSKHNILAS